MEFVAHSGRIKAIQLDYSEAHRHLVQAIRKAPQFSAVGFKQTVSCSVHCSQTGNDRSLMADTMSKDNVLRACNTCLNQGKKMDLKCIL